MKLENQELPIRFPHAEAASGFTQRTRERNGKIGFSSQWIFKLEVCLMIGVLRLRVFGVGGQPALDCTHRQA